MGKPINVAVEVGKMLNHPSEPAHHIEGWIFTKTSYIYTVQISQVAKLIQKLRLK